MKIRNGFVSNSSSSSFIVAFEKVPRTVESMVKMLYGPAAKENDIVEMYGYTMTKGHAAKQVLDDMKRKEAKCDRETLIAEFSNRYDIPYSSYSSRFDQFPETDPSNWLGLDYASLMEMWTKAVQSVNERERIEKEIRRYIENELGDCPRDYKSPEYKKWHEDRENLRDTDETLMNLYKEEAATWGNYEEDNKLRRKVAEADVDGFLKDNEGCKIRQFGYSDNDGDFFTLMEHSGVFRRLPHVEISNH
jgi:translation initiation factor 2 beta subunit (eIF-2beta)/eIF-5